MKFNLFSKLIVLSATLIMVSACSTLGRSEMAYLGDETREASVMGSASHFDFLGIGVNAESYGAVYERAVQKAFKNAPRDTVGLKSVKILKEHKFWPQVLGIAGMGLGGLLIAESASSPYSRTSPLLGIGLYLAGVGLAGINTYDLVVIADPILN